VFFSGATTTILMSRGAARNWRGALHNICIVRLTYVCRLVVDEALKIHNIQHSSLTEKILGPDDITQQINECLDRLDQGTQEHHVSRSSSSVALCYSALQTSGR
jgi:hypothetical protein